MSRIEALKHEVDALYGAKNPHRAEWADWLHVNHIFVVAEIAHKISKRLGADADLAVAAAMLHDIADAVMARESPRHEEESLRIAQELLKRTGFSGQEIEIIVDDAMKWHGCRNGNTPQTLEGRIMATADAVAHLTTEFYGFALRTLQKTDSMEEIRAWALPKIERDFNDKIFFPEIREDVRLGYERSKQVFQ